MSRRPPRGWNIDTERGSRVPETPCVPMKTPIQGKSWDLEKLKEDCPNVRLLIDLTATNTKPYFEPSEVRELDIEYRKILAGFGGNIPKQERVDEFISTVAAFDVEHENDDETRLNCTEVKTH